MSASKKYSYRTVQDNSGWSVEIIRRASSKKSVMSTTQDGFATETEAREWGEKEVVIFLKNLNLNEQNKRIAKQRQQF